MPPVILGPGATTSDDKNTSEMIHRLAAARKCECPCDCYDIINKLPTGYRIVRGAERNRPVLSSASVEGFIAEVNDPRPGYFLSWDANHCVWRPPGFASSPTDTDHLFNQATGQNAVWDDDKKQWIDTKTGKTLGYEQ